MRMPLVGQGWRTALTGSQLNSHKGYYTASCSHGDAPHVPAQCSFAHPRAGELTDHIRWRWGIDVPVQTEI
jgi:hypothetical protein